MRTNSNTAATVAAAAVMALGITVPAAPQSATANLAASVTVSNNCTISTTPLGFGAYEPAGAHVATDLDGTGSVTIACTQGAAATVGLSLGGHASGSTRRLSDGASNYLAYELYQDAVRTTLWGNAGGDLLAPSTAPSKAARNFIVYGRVEADQDVPAGSYADTVVATVNF